MDTADVLALIEELPGHRVAVIGDAIADEFVYGRVARVSREAPVSGAPPGYRPESPLPAASQFFVTPWSLVNVTMV